MMLNTSHAGARRSSLMPTGHGVGVHHCALTGARSAKYSSQRRIRLWASAAQCASSSPTASMEQTDDPEKAHGTTNVGLSEGSSGTSLSAVPVGLPHRPRFDEVSTS
jgi:hypothetical protein